MISNNVANLNTPGFKTQSLRFSDLSYSTLGGQGLARFGSGVEYSQSTINFRQGDLRASNNDLDLGVEGRGFLVLFNGEKKVYTRTGQFVLDKSGFVTERLSGYKLALLGSSGTLNTISLDGKRTSPPKATTEIKFADNLSSTATEHVISGVEVYDSNGGKQTWTVRFTSAYATQAGKWKVTVEDEKGAKISEGEIQFTGSTLEAGKDKLTVKLTPKVGTPSDVVLDFSAGVTAFSSGTFSSLRVSTKDGYAAGNLNRISVDADGFLVAEYSNTQTDKLGRVALADFDNLQALTESAAGLFEASSDANPKLLGSKESGIGQVKGQVQEASNVDLSQEFGELILVQRGFQASSQVVTAANEMIQQLLEMKGKG